MTARISSRDVSGRRTVAGLFPDRASAEQAIDELKAAGFTGDHIGVALPNRTAQGELIEETGTPAPSGATLWSSLGGLEPAGDLLSCSISSSLERQKSTPPGARRMVTGAPSR